MRSYLKGRRVEQLDVIKSLAFDCECIIRISPNFFRASIILNFFDFDPRIILKLFLNTNGVASSKTLRNIFQSLLIFYNIIKLSKSLYFVSIMQKYI